MSSNKKLKNPKNWAFAITKETMVNGDGRSCANVYPAGEPEYDQCVAFDFKAIDENIDEPFEAHLTHPSKDPGVLADILRRSGLVDESPKTFSPKKAYEDPVKAAISDPTALPSTRKNAEILLVEHIKTFTKNGRRWNGDDRENGYAEGFFTAAWHIWNGNEPNDDRRAKERACFEKESKTFLDSFAKGWNDAVADMTQPKGPSPAEKLATTIGEAWAKRDRTKKRRNAEAKILEKDGWLEHQEFFKLVATTYAAVWKTCEIAKATSR